ncbi:MAG: hypothetical protein AAB359_05590 [Elusimicrobiota bacterium]
MLLTLVWGGIVVYFMGWSLEIPLLLAAGMLLSAWGLVLFHRKSGHPARYAVISVFLALIPIFGPMIGLVLKPGASKRQG